MKHDIIKWSIFIIESNLIEHYTFDEHNISLDRNFIGKGHSKALMWTYGIIFTVGLFEEASLPEILQYTVRSQKAITIEMRAVDKDVFKNSKSTLSVVSIFCPVQTLLF